MTASVRPLRFVLVFLFALALLATAGCGDDARSPATSTPAGTPPPGAALPTDVARVVDVLARGDLAALNALVEELPEACAANPQGVGSPPRCPTGVSDGGTINTFRYISCERGYPGDQQREVTERVLKQRRTLYGVFRPQPGMLFTLIPKGDYSLVFVSETAQGDQLGERYEVRAGRIVGMWLACGPGLDTVRRMTDDVASWVVGPLLALPTPTPIPPTPAATADGYPMNRRTGMLPAPDMVLDALESRIPERILAHFAFLAIPCVTAPTGFPQPPLCQPGQATGTPVQVFPVAGCEGNYQTHEQAIVPARELADPTLRIWAIYRQAPKTPASVAEFPLGSQVIVLSRPAGGPPGQGIAIQVEGGNILSVRFGCGNSAVDFVKDVPAGQFILPPPR